MTPELLFQRRWDQIAVLIEHTTGGAAAPVLMPLSEGGGILIIEDWQAFHFFNHGPHVSVDVRSADTDEMIEGRRNCFRFDQPAPDTAGCVMREVFLKD